MCTFHLTNHPSKTKKKCWRSKDKPISNNLLWTPTYGHTSVDQPAKTYIHKLCADIGCSLEDLSGAVYDRNG